MADKLSVGWGLPPGGINYVVNRMIDWRRPDRTLVGFQKQLNVVHYRHRKGVKITIFKNNYY